MCCINFISVLKDLKYYCSTAKRNQETEKDRGNGAETSEMNKQ